MKKYFYIFILMLSSFQVSALEDIYPFTTKNEEMRFINLTQQLRCLVCQNQNLAESNAPLANDLRDQIYQKILHGQKDQEIIYYLVTRYGDFILYRPPLKISTFGLWFTPIVLLILGLGYLLFYIRKQQRV